MLRLGWSSPVQSRVKVPSLDADLKSSVLIILIFNSNLSVLWYYAARQARWADLMTSGMNRLEAQHAGFLAEDFKPNADWWGSSVHDSGAPTSWKARL